MRKRILIVAWIICVLVGHVIIVSLRDEGKETFSSSGKEEIRTAELPTQTGDGLNATGESPH